MVNLYPRANSRKIRSEEHTSELQSRLHLVCRLLLEKKKHRLPAILVTPQLRRLPPHARKPGLHGGAPLSGFLPPRPGARSVPSAARPARLPTDGGRRRLLSGVVRRI